MTADEAKKIAERICSIIGENYPNLSKYHYEHSVNDMVQYLGKTNEAGENNWRWVSYREHCTVTDWNTIRDWIKEDIIEGKYDYSYAEDKNKPDFDRGVLSAIRLIEHRVHCILDI